MKKILLVGKKSKLCRIYVNKSKINNFDMISHHEIKKIDYSKYSHLINFAFNPKLSKQTYKVSMDVDKILSLKAKENKLIYVFFSTRYIYSKLNSLVAKESIKKNKPENNYGKNKLKIENNLKRTLGNNLLILRLGTFLFFNLTSKGKLFSEKMLYNLFKNKRILFDFSKNIYKDFLTDDHFVKNLDFLINKKITGVYNLSSGIPIYSEEVALSVIKGFGQGIITFKNLNPKAHSFIMSNKKLNAKTKISLKKQKILDYCLQMGKKLKDE